MGARVAEIDPLYFFPDQVKRTLSTRISPYPIFFWIFYDNRTHAILPQKLRFMSKHASDGCNDGFRL